MGETVTYEVPAVHCSHCKAAIEEEVGTVQGVETVDVDLEAKRVTVQGRDLRDDVLRAAITEAGYEAV
jgi:copper chaperone